jgi:16S rRNA (adenine1518-N6/adenine1519-N6)-dimethyltransferase
VSPLSEDSTKLLLQKYSIRPSKKKGQSFLIDQQVARQIVAAANLTQEDRVLEIGGGLGILTRFLVEQAHHVYVIELEPGLVKALNDILDGVDNLTIIQGDALKQEMPSVNKVVSNLPYSISSPITFRLLNEIKPELSVLMYQKELVGRMLAEPGTSDYSRFSVGVQYLAEIEEILKVPAQKFYPIPAVDSSVVRMTSRSRGSFAREQDVFFWMTHGIYSYPNKQLRKALGIWCRNLGVSKKLADDIIKRTEGVLQGNERLRNLEQDKLVVLADTLMEFIDEGVLPRPEGSRSAVR